jgi:hypothetical protein
VLNDLIIRCQCRADFFEYYWMIVSQ